MLFLQCNRENRGDSVILLVYGVHLQQCVAPCWTNRVVDDGVKWGTEGGHRFLGRGDSAAAHPRRGQLRRHVWFRLKGQDAVGEFFTGHFQRHFANDVIHQLQEDLVHVKVVLGARFTKTHPAYSGRKPLSLLFGDDSV